MHYHFKTLGQDLVDLIDLHQRCQIFQRKSLRLKEVCKTLRPNRWISVYDSGVGLTTSDTKYSEAITLFKLKKDL